jgi:hypothetical protein
MVNETIITVVGNLVDTPDCGTRQEVLWLPTLLWRVHLGSSKTTVD